MKKININITEGCDPCMDAAPNPKNSLDYKNIHNNEEARMHRTTLAHLVADVKVLLDMVQDGDDLPEWLETKITKAGDYMSSAARYVAGNIAREKGQLEEEVTDDEERELKKIVIQLKKASKMHKGQADKIEDIIDEDTLKEEYMCEVDVYHDLHEILQDAITEDGEQACPECLYEVMVDASCDCSGLVSEAKYRGRKVKLNKPMRGDVKKFKVYVKDPKTGNIKKVNFGHGGSSARRKGEKTMRIRKSNPKARKSFRARHNCKNPGPKTKARYWSCRKW